MGTKRRLKRAARPDRGFFLVLHDPGWRAAVGHIHDPFAIPVLESSEPLLLKVVGVFSVRFQSASFKVDRGTAICRAISLTPPF
ncbi:MAG: hypothetical protein WCC90_07685 [Methylocella sp.]